MNTKVVADSLASNEPAEPPNLGQVIARLSQRLDANRIGTGDLAALRHMTRTDLPPAFWKIYLTHVPEIWRQPEGRIDAGIDRAWAALVRAMVEMAPNPHAFRQPFGAALGESKYSEDRFVRLLRAEGENLARELRVAATWLVRAGIRATNWEQPAHLLLGNARRGWKVWPDGMRHKMAHHYFRATATKQSSNQ